MLEIILIASGAFLAALFCVWVYRIAKSMHDSKFRQVKLAGQEEAMNIGRGSGTVELKVSGSNGAGNARKPWGW
ncbi:MAG: hypothetical protein V2I57_04210 [Xanthomonadales bacterium]|jgi:hypothetical protein|nr:hypothetical protein [Xanthomonadales bacterium]